ncbi:hypothetical protein PY546_20865 [Providencia stuartii]|nr:hypothetical protein [Providencia stuartii]
MTDEATGQTGQSLNLEIHQLDTISITSRIQGQNAAAGGLSRICVVDCDL